ncbi:P-loop containing nucleoside triphosphate hydrolase protein [Paraphysoderma sedebokerense]|nr:P-loop containing nucleoside triphosphate hydrolase protein [Paraphysoderma sedebokerense]
MPLKSINVKKNYRIQPVTGSFISGISENGTQYYFPKKLPKPSASRDTGHIQSGNLLGSSIFNMLDQIEREERARKQREDDELLIPLNDPLYAELNATTENRLWSDKYRPQSYHELIGDEVINREILLWVKEWDFCVFGDTKKSLKPKVRLTNLKKKNFKDAGDPLKRPDKKILLITGPPGLGKTTLANVIARQAGYNVVEINASDERTGSTIKDKLHNAIYNKSISNGSTNCKPKLVVIDEIDGVSGAGETNFIKLLVDLASVDVENESTETAKNKDKKKGFSRRPLTRPIICICNDHYVPVLRPLRSIAQIIQYRKPDITNLSTRLYDICQREGLKTDLRTLTGLCEVTDGDLRTCLNTLQFIRRKSTEFNISSLSNLNIGLKDSTKGLFTIWGEIFQLPNGKKRRNEILVKKNDQEGDVENESGRFIQRIVNLVQTCGEYDRLINGCFENYPLIRFHDLGLQKINTGLDWILYYDTLHSKSFSAGGGGGNGMILNQYLPYCFAMFHKVWSSGYKPYLEFPRTDYEAFVEHRNNQNILTSFYNHIPPITRNRFTKDSLVLELLSYLARIVTPNIKSANAQVMRPMEKQSLKNLVQILVSFRITLVQEKIGEGQYGFRIEPPIDKIISWATTIGGLRSILPSQYAVRQMIAHEVDTEMYRKNDPEAEKKTKKKAKKTLSTPVTASQKIIEKAPVDFFGRPIPAAPESLDSQGNAKPEKLKVRIWYKFNEGYSNAVRKPITIREFLM